ncbi:hypothetical protein [Rickettsiella endosymbiont of Dermanyssus gallinae]|uniref:hypothetical protein n=1 Tax=Rickettsiella endosymbiont of Dermanyssus gallinae TaxID=2856608 RepID=UPI001C531E0D|nr:hypothetical protein [Rickettsiella endosymbiont of Dermanyssus gallinae]
MNMFNQDSEFRIIQRLERLEKEFAQFKRDVLFALGLAVIFGFSNFLIHLFH